MPATKKTRSCFIIGPMKDAQKKDDARLKKIANQVIRPLLDEIEREEGSHYVVSTPYDLGMAGSVHIMNDVIFAIDRADIVIADLTGSNPNVFYELGICHALGRACIAIMEETQEKVEFDIASYRVFPVNIEGEQYIEAQRDLRMPIRAAHRSISDWARLENPVIDFFRAPITYISPTFALAQGYYLNFIKPVAESMLKLHRGNFSYQIGIATEIRPSEIEDTTPLPENVRKKLELHIVVPSRIEHAKRNFADRLMGRIAAAVVEGDGRSYTCFYRAYDEDTRHCLIDIPTTIRVLEDAVDRRMRHINFHRDDPDWQEIEAQEIDRFILVLQQFIDRHELGMEFSSRVKILRYDPDTPGELLWFHAALMNL
jgi:hypothetical protein